MRHAWTALSVSFSALAASGAVPGLARAPLSDSATPAASAIAVSSLKPAIKDSIPLYPRGTIVPLPSPEIHEDLLKNGQITIRNVSEPTLEIFRPAAGKANGTAIIVAPGGGFVALVYSNEGTTVAKRLAQQGITAFVLKYRLEPTAADPAQMPEAHMKEMDTVMSRAKSGIPVELPYFAGENHALQDAAQAIKIVRGRASEWGIDAKRIGVLGFSAGAFVAADLAIGHKASRPDFVGLIYGGLRMPVPSDAPPAFIAAAADDEFLPNDALQLFGAWKAAGRPVELHVFERGKHGFGMDEQRASSDRWFEEFVWWMQSRGFMVPSAHAAN